MARTEAPIIRPRRPGPAPALDSETEQRTILDAALRVLQRRGVSRMTLDDVLSEAELSTRSFYRHYSSKEDLLVALHRREAAAVGVSTRKVISAAPTAASALEAWVDNLLAIAYNPRRAARAGLLRSSLSMQSAGWEESHRAFAEEMTAPLEELLEQGCQDGIFPLADPKTDAHVIFTFTLAMMIDLSGRTDRPSQAEARGLVLRYVRPPLGVPRLRRPRTG